VRARARARQRIEVGRSEQPIERRVTERPGGRGELLVGERTRDRERVGLAGGGCVEQPVEHLGRARAVEPAREHPAQLAHAVIHGRDMAEPREQHAGAVPAR
jgi:hypothetical protein